MTTFIQLLDVDVEGKDAALRRSITQLDERVFDIDVHHLARVPGTPFAYWATKNIRDLFSNFERAETEGRRFTKGLCTTDDNRFIRLGWEIRDGEDTGWTPFVNGGASIPFYTDVNLRLKWGESGAELKAFLDHKIGADGQWSRWINSIEHYFREGFTWPLRASRFSPQALPAGCIFSIRSYVGFTSKEDLGALIAFLSSRIFDFIFKTLLGRSGHPEFVVGAIQKLPIPHLSNDEIIELSSLFNRAWSLRADLDWTRETSNAFYLPLSLRKRDVKFDQRQIESEIENIQTKIDQIAFHAYRLTDVDLVAVNSWGGDATSINAEDDDDGEESSVHDKSEESDWKDILSWSMGVAFGRFDLRLPTGERSIPPKRKPFDPLPSRSPGMWPEDQEPAQRPNILVDDDGHSNDLLAMILAAAERIHVDAPENLRPWLAKEFFPLHVKMYSKSRRKAPIYWQLATPSASYSAWLYIHAFNKDTLFRVQNDYVAPKLGHEERRLESLAREIGDKGTATQRRELAAQESFVVELRAFLEEVRRVAPLWNPSLDDGVIINFAPLWRLVPQHKAWQRELRATWDALSEGKYDWAHLAMHLWPERVVPKCAGDRSLAIAHGLEDAFWEQDAAGIWKERETLLWSTEELVAKRSSAAVKAAVKSLLEAPEPSGSIKRGRRSKAA